MLGQGEGDQEGAMELGCWEVTRPSGDSHQLTVMGAEGCALPRTLALKDPRGTAYAGRPFVFTQHPGCWWRASRSPGRQRPACTRPCVSCSSPAVSHSLLSCAVGVVSRPPRVRSAKQAAKLLLCVSQTLSLPRFLLLHRTGAEFSKSMWIPAVLEAGGAVAGTSWLPRQRFLGHRQALACASLRDPSEGPTLSSCGEDPPAG